MSQWLLQVLNKYGKNGLHSLYEPCLWALLLRARSLTALSTHLAAVPRSIHLSHLPLRHLEIFVCSRCTHSLALLLCDVSHNCTLESFTLAFNPIDGFKGMRDSLQLPDMHLRSMPSLKHVRLENCFPVGELSLPDDCFLFLEVVCGKDIMWNQHWEKLQSHTTVLRLNTSEFVDRPGGLQSFSKLQYLELKAKGNWTQDLAGSSCQGNCGWQIHNAINRRLMGKLGDLCVWQARCQSIRCGVLCEGHKELHNHVREPA